MRASLADQGLLIGLGANLPSAAGSPRQTLLAVRPLLVAQLQAWAGASLRLHWSPLYRTAPLGGPPDQPDYLNAVLLVAGTAAPEAAAALALLDQLQQLELQFQRQRLVHWGPRTLDLDLLAWGPLQLQEPRLQLPHPRWRERSFVTEPLRALQERLDEPLPLLPPAPAERLWPLPGGGGWPE